MALSRGICSLVAEPGGFEWFHATLGWHRQRSCSRNSTIVNPKSIQKHRLTGVYDRLHYGKMRHMSTFDQLLIPKMSTFRKAPLHQRRKKPPKGSCVSEEALIPRENFVVLAEGANTRRRRKSYWRCTLFLSTEATDRELARKAAGKRAKSDVSPSHEESVCDI